MHYHISTLHDTGWPVGDYDWLQRAVLLACIIKININKVILTVNERLFVVLHKRT
jgi:hypothetical protein